jgi:hypothetical protein
VIRLTDREQLAATGTDVRFAAAAGSWATNRGSGSSAGERLAKKSCFDSDEVCKILNESLTNDRSTVY